jgi:hypothetical protein
MDSANSKRPDLNAGTADRAKPCGVVRGRWLRAAALAVVAGTAALTMVQAGTISIPNASFESPPTDYASPNIDSWQKSAEPAGYVPIYGPWEVLTGIFTNNPAYPPNQFIDNCDGSQAAFLFALPEVALFQDYSSLSGTNTTPSHAFDAKFVVGRSYHLIVGVIGGGGNMTNGATLEISLYYRDSASNRVKVAAASITNTPGIFSNVTHLIDFQADVPAVKASDAWAGQNIGVQLLSTVAPDLAGGYWDLDNVHLLEIREPVLFGLVFTNAQSTFTLESEPGLGFEILATTNVALATSNWTSLGTLTNLTGSTNFTDTGANANWRFYRARQLP